MGESHWDSFFSVSQQRREDLLQHLSKTRQGLDSDIESNASSSEEEGSQEDKLDAFTQLIAKKKAPVRARRVGEYRLTALKSKGNKRVKSSPTNKAYNG